MRLLLIVPLLFGLIWIGACDDDNSTGSGRHTPLMTIKAVDSTGAPVPGLVVGSINLSDYLPRPLPGQALPSTQIDFSIPEQGYVTLVIHNYYGNMIDVLLDDELFSAGSSSVEWDNSSLRSGFYLYHMEVTSSPDAPPDFVSDKWVILETAPDPAQGMIGVTDDSGLFVTSDALLFPCVLSDPPPIVRYDQFGSIIDTVYDFYTDTVVVTLSDTAEPNRYLYFKRAVETTPNSFELLWTPTQP